MMILLGPKRAACCYFSKIKVRKKTHCAFSRLLKSVDHVFFRLVWPYWPPHEHSATDVIRPLTPSAVGLCKQIAPLVHYPVLRCCDPSQTQSHLYTNLLYYCSYFSRAGTAVAQWLRCCATNRKVAGSIPDGVIGIFHWHNLSDRTMALGSTQPVTEMSTRSISWG